MHRAGKGDELPDPEQAEVAMLKRDEQGGQPEAKDTDFMM